MSEHRRLDERRGRDSPRDRLRLTVTRRSGDADLEHDRRTFAVGHDLAREISAHLAQRRREGIIVTRRTTRTVREQHDRVVRRAITVDRDPIEAALDRGPQERLGLAVYEGVVGGDDNEHRREKWMNHSSALGHPTDGEARPLGDRDLRAGVGRQDRARGRIAALGREGESGGADTCQHFVERQLNPDHAGREHKNLLSSQSKLLREASSTRYRSGLALGAGGGIRNAGVDEDGLRLCSSEMALGERHRGGLNAVRRPHRRADGPGDGADDGDVRLAGRPDPGGDAARDKSPGGGDRHQV